MCAHLSTFRGYHAIAEVIERMRPLADWLDQHQSVARVITLRRRDLDLLQRWPKAADLHGIFTVGGVTWWRDIELRADRSAQRYPCRDKTR